MFTHNIHNGHLERSATVRSVDTPLEVRVRNEMLGKTFVQCGLLGLPQMPTSLCTSSQALTSLIQLLLGWGGVYSPPASCHHSRRWIPYDSIWHRHIEVVAHWLSISALWLPAGVWMTLEGCRLGTPGVNIRLSCCFRTILSLPFLIPFSE